MTVFIIAILPPNGECTSIVVAVSLGRNDWLLKTYLIGSCLNVRNGWGISSHPVHLATIDQHMSQYPQYEKPVGSPAEQSVLFEQRKRSSIGTAIHVLMLSLSVLGIIVMLATLLFNFEISSYPKSYILLSLPFVIALSILLAMGLRLNVAQWTYRCCGAVYLLNAVVENIEFLKKMAPGIVEFKGWDLLYTAVWLIIFNSLAILIATPLLLPMKSKTLCFLRPISIVMDKASPRV